MATRARLAVGLAVVAALALGLALWSRALLRRRDERPRDDVPRLALIGPASGSINVGGDAIRFEVGGFTDGIPAAAVAGEPALAGRFVDVDPAAPPGPACAPQDGAVACPDRTLQYCDGLDLRCHPRVPVIVSPTMVLLYDDQFAPEHELPRSRELLDGGRLAPTFSIVLGESSVAPPAEHRSRHIVGAIFVGVSARAKDFGMTVPRGYVMAWNRELSPTSDGGTAPSRSPGRSR